MYCRNCGHEVASGSSFCCHCGVSLGQGNHYCHHCGAQTDELAAVCVRCGVAFGPTASQMHYTPDGRPYSPKSKLAAGLLGIFLGCLGIHNFYLGHTDRAIAQLLLGTVGSLLCGIGPIVAGVWGLVEGIQILTGTIHQDSDGNELGN